MKALLLISAAATAVASAGLGAQSGDSKPDSTCTKYSNGKIECRAYRMRTFADSGFRNVVIMRMDSSLSKRAALGLELRATGTRRDTLGVFVEGVTPKGPAEAAGIIEGDRIAAINGVDLRTPVADLDDPYSNGLASHRLTREVQKLAPGTRVTLRVYSGGRFRDVQVVAGKASDLFGREDHFNFFTPNGGGMEFYGPGAAAMPPMAPIAPEQMQIIRERVEPLMRQGIRTQLRAPIEPLIQERLRELPRIRVGAPIMIRTLSPSRRTFRVERSLAPETPMPDYKVDITSTASADDVRALVATTIQDARDALKRLAEAGVV